MTKARRVLIATAGSAAALLVAGFLAFSATVARLTPDPAARADGIVVLTGGEDRVATGIQLVTSGYGRRVLISGANPKTHAPADIQRRLGGNRAVFDCCVDLGHEALDTAGNAEEARHWAEARRYKSLIVVTSNYHMPRSLLEFSRAMPAVDVIPCPVPPRSLQIATWWQHRPTARLLVGEYLKFLTSAARLGVSRVFAGLDHRPATVWVTSGPTKDPSR